MAADRGGVEAGVNPGEEDDEIFGDQVRNELVARGKELGFGGFPGGGQSSIHLAVSLQAIGWRSGKNNLLDKCVGNIEALISGLN